MRRSRVTGENPEESNGNDEKEKKQPIRKDCRRLFSLGKKRMITILSTSKAASEQKEVLVSSCPERVGQQQ